MPTYTYSEVKWAVLYAERKAAESGLALAWLSEMQAGAAASDNTLAFAAAALAKRRIERRLRNGGAS